MVGAGEQKRASFAAAGVPVTCSFSSALRALACALFAWRRRDLGDEVFRLAEAARQAFVLFVLDHHFLADVFVDLIGHCIVTHGKSKFFRNRRQRGQGANLFAFPGFADPAFVGKLLHKTLDMVNYGVVFLKKWKIGNLKQMK